LKVAIIGRSEILFDSMSMLSEQHEIVAVATAPEAPEYSVTAQQFLDWAADRRIPAEIVGRSADLDAFCSSFSADIAVSVNYLVIIPQHTIDRFPLGILNAHGGDLPRYRGNACQAWAIINGENQIGLCVHRMIGGEVDAGDILARTYLDLDDNTYVGDCLEWIRRETPNLFADALKALERNPTFVLERQSPNPRDALRCFPRRPEDGRIDWHLPARDVQRLIRASSRPFAGAYAYLDGQVFRVWQAEVIEHHQPYVATPGQVIAMGNKWFDVACGEAADLASQFALRVSAFSVDEDEFYGSVTPASLRLRLE
jgi:UDP-4-amino-4-deoxy-L-arabinose formyltransferase/UDP-glucuronic acid dehydrogenase (UDP-4-keto-hexauronic acid decarboxylating)